MARKQENKADVPELEERVAVSYTHLDVYKRQPSLFMMVASMCRSTFQNLWSVINLENSLQPAPSAVTTNKKG